MKIRSDDSSPIEVVLRNQVMAQHALTMDGDYFEILGVPRDATREDIASAHVSLLSTFADEALPPALVRDCETELRSIRTVLDEAARLMARDALRALYRSHARLARSPARLPASDE